MRFNLRVLLVGLLAITLSQSAAADWYCTEIEMVVDWDCTSWPGICYPIIAMVEYCTVTAPSPPPDPWLGPPSGPPPPPPPPPPFPPSVQIVSVDTGNPFAPMVWVDVSADTSSYGAVNVTFTINGSQVGNSVGGTGSYGFGMPAISSYGEAQFTLTALASNQYGNGSSNSQFMTRYSGTPAQASNIVTASWYKQGERPLYQQASFDHSWLQSYTSTSFSVQDFGGTARVQVTSARVTLHSTPSPYAPWFNAYVWSDGSTSSASHGSDACDSPYCEGMCYTQCTYAGEFGYSPTVHEQIGSITINGYGCGISGAHQSLTLP